MNTVNIEVSMIHFPATLPITINFYLYVKLRNESTLFFVINFMPQMQFLDLKL